MPTLKPAQAANHGKHFVVWMALSALLVSVANQSPSLAQDRRTTLARFTDPYTELGRKVPAFGGMFVDEDKDTLYVYLVRGELGDLAQADQAIRELFGPPRPPVRHLVELDGKYTFLQLREWRDILSVDLLTIPAVSYLGIAHARNRILVAVENSSAEPLIEMVLQELAVPRSAVTIEPASPPNSDDDAAELPTLLTAAESKTLQDRWRPAVGGLKIQIKEENVGKKFSCTFAFGATRGKMGGFLTAAHCAEDFTIRDAMVYQPQFVEPKDEEDDNFIGGGKDSYLPKYFAGKRGDFSRPQRRVCRLSDTVFLERFTSSDAAIGQIAQTAMGKIDWNGMTKYRIVAKQPTKDFVAGQKVMMEGMMSGRLEGTVTDPCAEIPVTGSNVTFLCQAIVDWKGKTPVAGDSGGPVFVPKGDTNDVVLFGVVSTGGAVSRIDWTEDPHELGSLAVCAMGFEC